MQIDINAALKSNSWPYQQAQAILQKLNKQTIISIILCPRKEFYRNKFVLILIFMIGSVKVWDISQATMSGTNLVWTLAKEKNDTFGVDFDVVYLKLTRIFEQ